MDTQDQQKESQSTWRLFLNLTLIMFLGFGAFHFILLQFGKLGYTEMKRTLETGELHSFEMGEGGQQIVEFANSYTVNCFHGEVQEVSSYLGRYAPEEDLKAICALTQARVQQAG